MVKYTDSFTPLLTVYNLKYFRTELWSPIFTTGRYVHLEIHWLAGRAGGRNCWKNEMVLLLFGCGSIVNTTDIISHKISIIVGSNLGTAVNIGKPNAPSVLT